MVNARTAFDTTQKPAASALDEAVRGNDIARVRDLLARGAELEARDENENTVLQVAAGRGYLSIVQLLVERGAEVNARNKFGYNPLIAASMSGRTDVVRFLIEKGAVLDEVETSSNRTALMYAVLNNHPDIVQALIEGGADIGKETTSGNTAMAIARNARKDNIIQMLEEGPALQARLAAERAEAAHHEAMHNTAAANQKRLKGIKLKL